MGAGEGGGGGGGGGGHQDIEEKFKKEISKEMANLKEFLIQQGKEIVKIKQENKALRESSVSNGDSSSGPLSSEIKAVLDKHSVALEKQKENTTKLSKLCLGTLNELEKFEKKAEQEKRETSAVPKTEDRLRRLTEENKKLIHLVTSLDQQVALLENKLTNGLEKNEEQRQRSRHSSNTGGVSKEEVLKLMRDHVPVPAPTPRGGNGLGKDEVNKLVQEALAATHEENAERNAQVQSLITEVQNIIGQTREVGTQCRELTDKVRRIEGNDTAERFGLELAGALSRLERIEAGPGGAGKVQADQLVLSEQATRRIAKLEQDIKKIELDVKKMEKLEGNVGKLENVETSLARVEQDIRKLEKLEGNVGKLETGAGKVETSLARVEAEVKKIERLEAGIAKVEAEAGQLRKEIAKADANLGAVKTLQDKAGMVEQGTEALNKRVAAAEKQVESVAEQVKGAKEMALAAKEALGQVGGQVEGSRRGVEEVRAELEESMKKLEADCRVGRAARDGLELMDIEVKQAVKTAHTAKSSTEDLGKRLDRLQKEEEAARLMRKEQSTMSVEDVRKDLARVQEQGKEVEERLHHLQKATDSANVDNKSSISKLAGEVELMSEKVKSVSLSFKEDKYKTEEKLSKLEDQIGASSKSKDELERRVSSLASSQTTLETTIASSEEMAKASSRDVLTLKGDLSSVKANVDKALKAVEENGTKIFGCVHDCDSLKDAVEKVKKAVDRRPAAEELDKKSELTNKLYNDLAAKIEDVDSNLQKEVKKTRGDAEKSSKDLARLQIGVDEATKEVKFLKEDVTALKMSMAEVKNCPKDLASLKADCDKSSKDVRAVTNSVEDVKREIATLKTSAGNASAAVDKIKTLENEIDVIKKANSSDKLVSVEKEILSLRSDHEKLSKDSKGVSTEVKYFDSTLKKEAEKTKTEFSSISKSVKDVQKDLNTLHNMVEVLNSQNGSSANSDDLSQVKTDLVKVSAEIKESVTSKCKAVEESLKKKLASDLSDSETKMSKLKDELSSKVNACSTEVKTLEKRIEANTKGIDSGEVDKRIKSAKDDLNSSIEAKNKATKDELNTKQTTLSNELKALEKKVESSSKGVDSAEVDKRVKTVKDELTNSVETKVKSAKDEFNTKVAACTAEVKSLEKRIESNTKGIDSGEVDKRVKSAKDELNTAIEAKLKTNKDDMLSKVDTCSKELKALEKKVEANGKGLDGGEVDKRVKSAKDEMNTSIEAKIKAAKDELNTKVTSCSTEVKNMEKRIEANSKGIDSGEVDKRVKAAKDELSTKIAADNKALEKKLDGTAAEVKKMGDLGGKVTKQEEKLAKLKTSVDSLEASTKSSNASGLQTGDELKKEMDKINQALKESLKSVEGKVSAQEAATKDVATMKTTVASIETKAKEIDSIKTQMKVVEARVTAVESHTKECEKVGKENTDKIGKLEKSFGGSAKTDESAKKDLEKLSKTMTDKIDKVSETTKSLTDKLSGQEKSFTDKISSCQKTLTDKISAQEKCVKEVTDKIEKLDSSSKADSSSSSKLVTLTKAIDSIQENSKSLENMVKGMKTEFATPKDLEKLRAELGKGGMGLDPNDATMGPIMDSLIMTNDRPYVDCATLTPMTGTGLVKFERFNAMNKLPWDDINDQFVIQEPGVYMVFVTAILQDACLSIKVASNLAEREIVCVGSRDGLVGCSAPTYVCRNGMLQIDDDENVAETILVEIHADNEESFIDKNVTLTIFKIGESPGTD